MSLLPNSVSVCVPAHEVNYFGSIKHAGIVPECKLGQENNTHTLRSGTEHCNPLLLCVSIVMQVVLLAALLKPRGKTQKCPSVISILFWRGWSWGWSSWHRYINPMNFLQIHTHIPMWKVNICCRFWFYYCVSDPKQRSHSYVTHVLPIFISLALWPFPLCYIYPHFDLDWYFDLLSDQVSMCPWGWLSLLFGCSLAFPSALSTALI